MVESIVWIGYTTQYRTGGPMLKRVAETLADQKSSDHKVVCVAVESKKAFVDAMSELAEAGTQVSELHFVGHSGMYGPMFGTTAWPEQLSPHEWRSLDIPFTKDAVASFHCCRSARWFAPFFARTFGIVARGYNWYTTFSTDPDKFRCPTPFTAANAPIYVFGCHGKKSHGLVGSLKKYSGLARPEPIVSCLPPADKVDATYDSVADLYDQAYTDIRVRKDEWAWLSKRIAERPRGRVLDIGCGNGALLNALAPSITQGIGVDLSPEMLKRAAKNNREHDHLSFAQITGPTLPCEDQSIDTVISLLSFRYLDWDPIMEEIHRVLAPGGKLFIIDMVASPPKLREFRTLISQKLSERIRAYQNHSFREHLVSLVTDKNWKTMLDYNPIRSEHEMRWYLESRFPQGTIDVLNIGMHARVLAFDSGSSTTTPAQ